MASLTERFLYQFVRTDQTINSYPSYAHFVCSFITSCIHCTPN